MKSSKCILLLLLVLPSCVVGPVKYISDPSALGPYSAAVISGEHVFVAGKIGERGGSFEREASTAIDAIELELTSLGLELKDVVQSTVYLTDMNRYAEFNVIYGRRFQDPYPARACVAVAALPGGARVEIVVVARRR